MIVIWLNIQINKVSTKNSSYSELSVKYLNIRTSTDLVPLACTQFFTLHTLVRDFFCDISIILIDF